MIAMNETLPPVQTPSVRYGHWPEASLEELGVLLQREDWYKYGTIDSITGSSLNEASVAQDVRRQICGW